jgi:hypothetical protein
LFGKKKKKQKKNWKKGKMDKPTKWTKFENKFHSFSFCALARALHIQSHDLHLPPCLVRPPRLSHHRKSFKHQSTTATFLSLLGKAPSQIVWKF